MTEAQTLLETARALQGQAPARTFRSLHHFACTGGTLISRGIAALPNTLVLSEVDPLSPMTGTRFVPTDLIGLIRHGSRPMPEDVLVAVFRAGLEALLAETHARGLRLVLRDHAHSQFCQGAAIPDRPTLREMLPQPLRSMVSVRHPLDSWLSLLKRDWVRLEPATLEEYGRRYLAFLDRHADCEVLRYEDFVADAETAMQRLCAGLDLAYDPGFRDGFAAIALSGDSGRRGDTIAPRPRHTVPQRVAEEAAASPAYGVLCARLGYDPAP